MATRGQRVGRVLGGIGLMLAFVAVVLAVLVRQAGGWGVPYFSFTSAHGSPCTNGITGYTCSPLTLEDVEFFGDVDLPAGTSVVSGRYHATHDYQLHAQLHVPRAGAAVALQRLNRAYGRCRSDVARPAVTASLRSVCVMADDDGESGTEELSSRLYTVATGLATDGSRQVAMAIRSR